MSSVNTLPISVACIALIVEGKLLATQRPAGKSLGGLWELPGGKVEAREDPEQALRRELVEELKLEVGELLPMTPVTHRYEFATIALIPFLCRSTFRPNLEMIEHQDLRWIGLKDLRELEWAPADLPILEELKRL